MRTESARLLIKRVRISVLKGNAGEIGALANAGGRVRGVDSQGLDGDPLAIGKEFARQLGLTVVISGAKDIVTDGTRSAIVEKGHAMMGKLLRNRLHGRLP